ncbi:hypothetical protein L7F22_039930 [Adiantum nelumboides]|nr:hypothetical protein [Adiantum nelumboides]
MAAALPAVLVPCFSPTSHSYKERRGDSTSYSTVRSGENLVNVAISSGFQQKEQSFSPSTTGQFYYSLQKCMQDEDTALGEEVYSKIVQSGLNTDSFLGCHLIRMFSTFGDLMKANEVFEELRAPSVFAWSAIISAHSNLGGSDHAIDLYFEMRTLASEPDGHVFVAVLQACASTASLAYGTLLHHDIIETGYDSCIHVNNTLIDMYVKCGSLQDACLVFSQVPQRDVVTWNAMIGGYGQNGHVQEALLSFRFMSEEGLEPNNVSILCCLSSCSNSAAIEKGREVHAHIIKHGSETDIQVDFALIEMYIACGFLEDARFIFDEGRINTETIDFMVVTYSTHGHDQEALQLMQSIQEKGIACTISTFIFSLRACASIEDLDQGWKIHSDIIEKGFEHDKFVGNTLVDLYGKCHSLDDAKAAFHRLQHQDVVSWSVLISGYTAHECSEDALKLFREMQKEGLQPNEITFASVLKACSGEANLDNGLEHGMWIHSLIIAEGFEQNIIIGSSLVDMYTKCGDLEGACSLVNKRNKHDVVTWSALITGFVQHGDGQEALECFKIMQSKGIQPTAYTIVGVLKACSLVVALEQAKQIHEYTICRGLELDSVIGGALVDMYARCGSLKDACSVFHSLESPDIISWGTMISSFAQHNDYESAIECFHSMEEHGLLPNPVIFTCLLNACSHTSRIEDGCRHFKSIREHYGLLPALEHYYSLVELLGHGSQFDEAEDLMESVPFRSTIVGWTSLLAASRRHGNVKLGKRCFERAVSINPGKSSEYKLMWNLYTGAGLINDAEKIEELRLCANAWKKPAKAFIEIDNHVHSFIVGDKCHPQSKEIYAKLESLSVEFNKEGYSPSTNLIPGLGMVKEAEDKISVHAEKLAIAFGLISTAEGTTIRLSKNLRVCSDCHAAAKAISKVERRDIIISDAYQIHHFQDGACSCVNFW